MFYCFIKKNPKLESCPHLKMYNPFLHNTIIIIIVISLFIFISSNCIPLKAALTIILLIQNRHQHQQQKWNYVPTSTRTCAARSFLRTKVAVSSWTMTFFISRLTSIAACDWARWPISPWEPAGRYSRLLCCVEIILKQVLTV